MEKVAGRLGLAIEGGADTHLQLPTIIKIKVRVSIFSKRFKSFDESFYMANLIYIATCKCGCRRF